MLSFFFNSYLKVGNREHLFNGMTFQLKTKKRHDYIVNVIVFVGFTKTSPLVVFSSDDRIRFELGAASFLGFFI